MDHYLRGIDNGVEREQPVRYFVMGENQWHESASWPPAAEKTSYYLGNGGTLSTKAPLGGAKPATFISDPSHPVMNSYDSSGAHDYRELTKRSDVLSFETAPLGKDIEVSGPIEAVAYISCACRDTDLYVRLLDVVPDGTAFNVMSPGLDVIRASYRDPQKGRQLLEPGQIYELRLEHLITSNVFQKGHRIDVQVSATFFPNFSRNLHTGESEATSAKMRSANISLYVDSQHPSRIILPVAAN